MRVITRLDETCREVRDAARVIGDAELFKKMEEAQIKIKRDSMCHTCFPSSTHSLSYSCIRRQFVFLATCVAIYTRNDTHTSTDSCTHTLRQQVFLASPIY